LEPGSGVGQEDDYNQLLVTTVPAVQQSALEAAGAVVTEVSLNLSDPDLDWEDYERLGVFLGSMNRACSWWVGDFILYGEKIYGELYAQIEEALGLAPQTLANRASVARHVPPNRRRAALPFGVHAEVAYLEPRDRDLWLDKAERGQWTRAKLREEMRAARGITGPDPMGDLAVTGKSEDSPHEDPHEEHPNGVPAAIHHGNLLGYPVSDQDIIHQCPSCGHTFV
jgi:hypothetical protein